MWPQYQWYKNGEAIPGATKPYYYAEGDLDFNADYTVLLTRENDSVQQFTCPIRPERRAVETPNSYPTMMPAGRMIRSKLDTEATVTFYTLTGTLYSSVRLPSGEASFAVPTTHGYYILSVTAADGKNTRQKILITP